MFSIISKRCRRRVILQYYCEHYRAYNIMPVLIHNRLVEISTMPSLSCSYTACQLVLYVCDLDADVKTAFASNIEFIYTIGDRPISLL